MSFSTTASNQAVHGSVDSRDSSSPRSPPPPSSSSNAEPSRLALHIMNNNQTPADTSSQALQRAFSAPDQPALQRNHRLAQDSKAVHQGEAQAAIDKFNAVMNGRNG